MKPTTPAIEDLRLAVALSRSASLSAAARSLDVTPPALSMRLRKLEATLGASLAVRSAHRLRLTSEGERFAREAADLLQRLEALPESFSAGKGPVTGTLRIAAPFGYGRQRIAPALAGFSRLHPGVRVELELRETPWPDKHDSDAVVHVGAVRDSSWVAHVLESNERWLCASPAYLQRRPAPRHPRDLAAHDCICIRENEEDVTLWRFVRPAPARARAGATKRRGPGESVRVSPRHACNDGTVARAWAEAGLGVVVRSQWDAAPAIASGSLVRLLPGWQLEAAPALLLVPTRKGRSARVEALVAYLREAIASR